MCVCVDVVVHLGVCRVGVWCICACVEIENIKIPFVKVGVAASYSLNLPKEFLFKPRRASRTGSSK